jgi:5'-nucleotidase
VRQALDAGVPAAQVYPHSARASEAHPNELRIAFDGDAVLFSDEAELIYQRDGLDAFQRHEVSRAATPLPPGPFKPLLEALHRLQRSAGAGGTHIRTALVTARSAPAHERAIRTLMDWQIEVDEAIFLGGLPKGPFLREFEPDFFFDDQTGHVANAAPHVPSGHVAAGVRNLTL